MANHSKLKALLQAWLDYIQVENLSNAKVEAGNQERPNIWETGLSLIGDQLLIDETQFKALKQTLKSSKPQSPSLAVTFPQLYEIQSGIRLFRPLFAIDISPIFQGNFRKKGWDLTAFDFQPVLPNLMQWYKLEEEDTETLVTREGLKIFLETTFHLSFKTLQDFMERIELPPLPIRSKLSPYLLNFEYVPFNHNLKKDLSKISSQSHWDWAIPSHPAYEYLFGQPHPGEPSTLFLGAFPTTPPDKDQAQALKHSQTHPITAVMGPPGTGKTTLVLHKIALQVVKGALHLATTGESPNILTLVASTNNRAVSNVEQRIASHVQTNRFYLSGGSRELVELQVLPKLLATLDELQKTPFYPETWELAKNQVLSSVQQLQAYLQQDEQKQTQRIADERLAQQLGEEIQHLQSLINNLTSELDSTSVPEPPGDYSQFPLYPYQQIEQQLELAWKSLAGCEFRQGVNKGEKAENHLMRLWRLVQRLWQTLTHPRPRSVLKGLHQQIESPVLATLATPFPFQIPLTVESLLSARLHVSAQVKTAQIWQQQQQRRQSRQQQLASLQSQRNDLENRYQQLKNRLTTYPQTDFYSRFYSEFHALQVQLFEESWQFLQQEALRRQDEVASSIRTYLGVLNHEWEAYRQLALNWRNIYRDLSLLFPVFLSTLHSIRRQFPYPDSGCIDQLIIDEAGQIPVHQVFPALVRCRQALIVGDPKQLEPTRVLSAQSQSEYYSKAFGERGLTETDYHLYSPTVCTAYHRAAGGSGQWGDLGQGLLLRPHYRSVPVIASFCDRLCNYNLSIQTSEKPSRLGANLIAVQIEGLIEKQVNWAEVEAVEALLSELLAVGYDFNSDEHSIGVISPYRSQANALETRLRSRWRNFPADSIGTVHTFQGGQKSTIIVSTRQSQPTDKLWFINRQPNLLNVAVSRAKELFILVGNLERLKTEGYTQQLVDYIEQFGTIRASP